MRIQTLRSRVNRRGFSLTEIVCAMGLIASAAVPMLGLLAQGLTDAQHSANARTVASLRSTVRQSKDAFVETRLTAAPGIGFSSTHLEAVQVTFHAVPSGTELGRSVVQRAR
jgi:prepilin-type N-terminal cleavage/methylation domain-containing protein